MDMLVKLYGLPDSRAAFEHLIEQGIQVRRALDERFHERFELRKRSSRKPSTISLRGSAEPCRCGKHAGKTRNRRAGFSTA